MATTTFWSPNQATVAQVETYTFTAPSSVGNTYSAAINGKTVTYSSVSGDTATSVATALFNLLNNPSTGIAAEFGEVTWANPSAGVVTARASTPGTPFANVPGTSAGLVLSTGNGLANGIATTHTQANLSPSDVNDPTNWLRVTAPAPGVRALPQNGDAVIVGNSTVPMLWNLTQLAAVQFASYTRTQDMTGQIGLPITNPNKYTEWRGCYLTFVGPQGSTPAGGLQMVVGAVGNGGNGPLFESYNTLSQLTTLAVLSGRVVNFLGVHTLNSFTLLGGVALNVAVNPGEIATLNTSLVNGKGTLTVGTGVTWTTSAVLTVNGGLAQLSAAPSTLALVNGGQANIMLDGLTWATITAQNGSRLTWYAGGVVTNLTLATSSFLDKSNDARALTITNSTLDGDTCQVADPLNTIVWTNATTVKQRVQSGPFTFTGTRTVKVI